MLAPLDIKNSFVSDLYMEVIADMISQLQHLNLDQKFIQQQHDINCKHLY